MASSSVGAPITERPNPLTDKLGSSTAAQVILPWFYSRWSCVKALLNHCGFALTLWNVAVVCLAFSLSFQPIGHHELMVGSYGSTFSHAHGWDLSKRHLSAGCVFSQLHGRTLESLTCMLHACKSPCDLRTTITHLTHHMCFDVRDVLLNVAW